MMVETKAVGRSVTVNEIEKIISREKENLKIHEYAFTTSDQVVFSDDVRSLCERNACGMYGKSWACPPAVGSVEDCKTQCSEFPHAFVFTSLATLQKKYDVNGWREAMIDHEAITEKVVRIFRSKFDRILALSTEGCTICKTCTYPEKPCWFPERMFPATEGFGIYVIQLAQTCGVRYYNGPNTVTFFSILFF
jgi:predicted metal-binding protein